MNSKAVSLAITFCLVIACYPCSASEQTAGLLERLKVGEDIVVAEGYLFNFEARGYLKAGAFVPEVVIEHPGLVRELHEEFVHAGSDVVQAFTVPYHTVQNLKTSMYLIHLSH